MKQIMREINLHTGSKLKSNSGSVNGSTKSGQSMPRSMLITLIVLIVAAVILGAMVIFGAIYSEKIGKAEMVDIDSGKYYAVFLSNGQVYFGKLSSYNTDSPKLADIYYLQLAQSPQAATEEQQPTGDQAAATEENTNTEEGKVLEQPAQTDADKGLTLIKLGEELHGPEDSMILNKEQILFIEQLKNDGKVVKAIDDYKANKDKK
jgi:hypothetical protein